MKNMPYIETVQKAQAKFVNNDSCAAYVTDTETYGKIDQGWHYSSDGYIKMGQAFAKAMSVLERRCALTK